MSRRARDPDFEDVPTGLLVHGLWCCIHDIEEEGILALTPSDVENFPALIAELEFRKVIVLH